MRRLICAIAIFVVTMFASNAWAGSVPYYSSKWWTPGMGGSSAFSSSWWQSGFAKAGGFDTTVTFIDNTGYNWHATVRGWATWQHTHWLSSDVKKAHCRSNVSFNGGISSTCVASN
ncbi:MAG: hypothetical protein H0U46_04580 [Actinobacteria bacterium]|nr:hypothetical protein [Actinomycetota bacterium]